MTNPTDERAAPMTSLWRGALAGLAAGLAAALAMSAVQSALTALAPPQPGGEDEPATQQAADRVSLAVTGARLPEHARAAGGEAVHVTLGAILGIFYSIAAEYRPSATAGFGAPFGMATAALLDEGVVPLLGLGPSPARTPARTHAYSIVAHLVFGTVAEGARRLARTALRPVG